MKETREIFTPHMIQGTKFWQKPPVGLRCGKNNNIKIDRRKLGCEDTQWIQMAQDKV